ncbi:mannose-6-phosphate isomerase [Planktothrix agardhii 1033]|nr:mannose-6-phosphate isomerase [Planktothrix agardhii 1033]
MVAVKESVANSKASTENIPSIGNTPTELRPWGSFTTLEEGPGYKIKRIEVKPGHRCGDSEEVLFSNQSTYVPQCTSHRLENPGVIPLILIEVQNGEYLGEDDIIRFQDDYARTPA